MPSIRKKVIQIILFTLVFRLAVTPVFAQVRGDADGNGNVDGLDYVIWLNNYNKQTSNGVHAGDFDGNGNVDGLDYVIWLNSYGNNTGNSPTLPAATASPSGTAQPGEMWITKNEIAALPSSGTAWTNMHKAATGSWGTADLKNQDNKFGLNVLAGALVYAKTGDTSLRMKVRDGILSAKRTMDQSGEWQTTNGALSLGRQLGAFVIAADLINLKNFDTQADKEFRDWLQAIRTTNVGTHGRWKNLKGTCENSANNWGTFACPSRIAASIYLGDTADVARAANIIRAFMGERQYYPGDAPGVGGYFQRTSAGESAGWDCNKANWTAINPPCSKSGTNIDGALVEDAARGGSCCTLVGDGNMYSWEVLQGLFVSTELLYRTGKFGNPYSWSNQALKRSMDFIQRQGWRITNPAPYVPWMANKRYGTSYPTQTSTSGRIMSWGDWLYQK